MPTRFIVGPPGTGKTSTIARTVEDLVDQSDTAFGRDRAPVAVLSMTRAAAEESLSRTAANLNKRLCSTIHAAALRAVREQQPELQLTEGHEGDFNAAHPAHAVSVSTDDSPDGQSRGDLPGDTARRYYDLYRAKLFPRDQWPAWITEWADVWDSWKVESDLLDFGDAISYATRYNESHPERPTHIITDESQDCSAAELALLRVWAKHAKSLTLVGDPDQAVFTWRGAYPQMFADPRFERTILSQSYRVPAPVHARAVATAERIADRVPAEYHPAPHDGSVVDQPVNINDAEAVIQIAQEYLDRGDTAMVITPCRYQLDTLVRLLRDAGEPFANPWAADNHSWNPMGPRKGTTTVDRLNALLVADRGTHDDDRKMWSVDQVKIWTPLFAGVIKRGAKEAIAKVAKETPDARVTESQITEWIDRDWFYGTLWPWFSARDRDPDNGPGIADLRDIIREHGAAKTLRAIEYPMSVAIRRGPSAMDLPPRLYLGTIHSFKGAEADAVILCPDLSKRFWESDPDDLCRMGYVAMTRARHDLHILQPSGPMYAEW